MANEDDVVLAFRQAVEEEIRRAQHDGTKTVDVFAGGASTEDAVRRLSARHDDLEHEVKLLRTIILRLISEPVDEQQ
ncbi:MAG TPA: hypothetical protein VM821_03385 [Abditibacteriaceae bacterium]|jgi:hypothetical protein|nr:hypothetical protein [Abditibacteriaceae bacterium]